MPPPDSYKPQESPIRTQIMASKPGVARDGTRLNRRQYIDAQWCRWYQDRPRKMGGYKEQVRAVDGIVRAIDIFSVDAFSYINIASGRALSRYAVDNATGANSGLVDRTPAAYLPDDSFNWQFSQQYLTAGNDTQIFASGTPSASILTGTSEHPVYYGDIVATTPLIKIPDGLVDGPVTSSGGCCAVGPFLFLYGADGVVKWSTPSDPLDFEGVGSGDARPIADKIVRGYPIRGQSGPAIIMWSLSSVVLGQFVGGTDIFDFTTMTNNASIMSSNGIVEHAGIYYWATTSGFSMFNGVVRDLPNDQNRQWFLNNVNISQRQKVFAFKVPRWSEIWWCFPYGTATECTHAVVYNWLGNFWYDTELPNGGRSAGFYEFIL